MGSTPDGREGFYTLFLRRHFGTYLIDQFCRGRAGRSTVSEQVNAAADDQFWFENFRMGVWPDLYEGSQFPTGEAALNQFFRQITPNTGAYGEQVIATSLAALCDTLGGGILITHSQGGGPGWHTAIRSRNVKAIASYEPSSGFVFPEGETPEPLETISPFGARFATFIPMDDFMKLTRIPIIFHYGYYIATEPSDNWAMDSWRVRLKMGSIMPNPTYAKVQEGARLVRESNIDFILAVGGGSVIDCYKIVSAQARMDEDVWDAWYVHHRFPTDFVPMGAVVTASGTGAEQNNGAVITHEEKKLKQPLLGAFHSFTILDSDLTKTLPMKQVISGACDTLSHCM